MSAGMSEAEAQELAAKWVKKLQDALDPEYREMIASYGGGEAYLRWVRGYDDLHLQPISGLRPVNYPTKTENELGQKGQ